MDELKKLMRDLKRELKDIDKTKSFKRTIDAENIKGVIDISLDKEVELPKENFNDGPVIKDYRYWILKLDRYYKNPAMRINQLNVTTLKMYAKLCESLEVLLNEKGTTVARLVSKLRRESVHFDIYYLIYQIAENAVLSYYNPHYNKSPDKFYKSLENFTDPETTAIVRSQALVLKKMLPEADDKTREYFKLTDNGRVSVWWDVDGKLREKYNFTREEELAINQISKRSNVLWNHPEVYPIFMDMYLATLRAIFDDDSFDNNNLLMVIKPYTKSKEILDSILLITEKNIRNEFSFFSWISTDKAVDMVKEVDDGKLYKFIRDYQDKYLEDLDFEKKFNIHKNYFIENTNKAQDYVNYLHNYYGDTAIYILNQSRDWEGFEKALNALLKFASPEEEISALYFIYKLGYNKPSHEKVLFKYIIKDNYDKFIDLVNENDELSEKLIEDIMNLSKIQAKKIDLNREMIADSKKKLNATVELVNNFYDDEPESTVADDSPAEEEPRDESSFGYDNILKSIIENGSLSKDEMVEMAKNEGLTLNTFIGNINDSLFDYVGDQTIIVDGDEVIIDEFYVDMIKELVDGN